MKKLLKGQKGITGADVVIAAIMVLITVGVISMLFVNTSLQSRNVTRTAGATRIATNIIENIKELSYDDFVIAYDELGTVGAEKYAGFKKVEGVKVFNTSIPNGYTFYIRADKAYGTHTEAGEKFDLVRDIDIFVTYKVGKAEQNVNFELIKQRELIGECNAPNISTLRLDKLDENMDCYPIKYSSLVNGYVKATENDYDWYNYTNKQWATVVVSSRPEEELFDINGKYSNNVNDKEYVWVPSFYVGAGEKFAAFEFNNSGKIIVQEDLVSLTETDPTTGEEKGGNIFKYYSFADKPAEFKKPGDSADEVSGYWVELTHEQINSNKFASILYDSQYGGFEIK